MSAFVACCKTLKKHVCHQHNHHDHKLIVVSSIAGVMQDTTGWLTLVHIVPDGQVRLLNGQRHWCLSPMHDGLLLEEAHITSYCEAVILDSPEEDTRGYVAPVCMMLRNETSKALVQLFI